MGLPFAFVALACTPQMNYKGEPDSPLSTATPSPTPTPSSLSVISIIPASGSIIGGESVTITGDLFTASTTVTLGGKPCTSIILNSATSITCVTPAGWPGARDVVVTDVVSTEIAALSNGFSYDPQRLSLVSKNLGTSGADQGSAIAIDSSGNAWITGNTDANFGGGFQGGASDAFIAKYDASGALIFSKNLGTSGQDVGNGITVDSTGDIWVTGYTAANFGGGFQGGASDAFIAKYDASGALIFSKNFGTAAWDVGVSIVTDSLGNAWITGFTVGDFGGGNQGGNNNFDAFVLKVNSSGTLVFSNNLGTSGDDYAQSLSRDSLGNIWITGATQGDFGGGNQGGSQSLDAFIAKYDAAGTLLLSSNLGTSANDRALGIALDPTGNAWVTGSTEGNFGGGNGGGSDAFIAKFENSGSLLFSKNLGTSADDLGLAIGLDALGNAFITGYTYGNFGGGNQGGSSVSLPYDAFIAKYDAAGTSLYSKNFGSGGDDYSTAIALDASQSVWMTGTVDTNLGGGFQGGGTDAFVYRIPVETLGPVELSIARGISTRPSGGSSVVGVTAGTSNGDFGGGALGGTADAYFQIYDSLGDLTHSVSFGTSGVDDAKAVAVDASNVSMVVGETTGSLSANLGNKDAFAALFSSSGVKTSAFNLGTAADDSASAVAVDVAGNFYVTGYTAGDLGNGALGGDDAFLAKFTNAGILVFAKNFGTASNDRGNGIVVDGSGDVWITGYTEGDLAGAQGGRDAFLARFNPVGVLQHASNLSTAASDEGKAITLDSSGNIFVAGVTEGDFGNGALGNTDAFLAKFDSSGAPEYAINFGSTQDDTAFSVKVSSNDQIYVVGETSGAMGLAQIGQADGFIGKFDTAGNYRGAANYGSTLEDHLYGLSIDPNDHLFAVGQSFGVIEGRAANSNGQIVFAKLTPRIPPTALLNLVATAVGADQISLTWDASDDTTRYVIQRSDDGGATWTTITTNATGTTYSDTGLNTGTTYSYTVTPYNATVPGTISTTVSATPTYPNPIVTSLDVTTGPVTGGTVINITGQYFEADATVTVGGRTCLNIVFNSATSLTCETPIGFSGQRTVSVTNVANALSGSLANAFTYDPDPGFVNTITTSQNLGTGDSELVLGIALDPSGNAWVVGQAEGDLGGGNQGNLDAFIAKYNTFGTLMVSQNLGTIGDDYASSAAIDASGNLWIAGLTTDDFGGGNQGGADAFIAKYDASGTPLFSKNLGTAGEDTAVSIASDGSGNIWVTGYTDGNFGGGNQGGIDGFVAKYDSLGVLVFAKNLGTSGEDYASSIALDASGNAWVTGQTDGSFAGGNQGDNDVFIAKFDPAGSFLFAQNLGTSGSDLATGVALDGAQNAWVTGSTTGNLGGGNQGAADAFIAKYDSNGSLIFAKNLGTSVGDFAYSIAIAPDGYPWITGRTSGDFGGGNQGGTDGFIAKYDSVGTLLFSKNLGTNGTEQSLGISMDSSGNAWVAGVTTGDFGGGNQGGADAFIAKINPVFDIANVSAVPPDTAQYRGVAKDTSGYFYTIGTTSGNLGDGNLGNTDVVIAKYAATTVSPDVPGTLIWSQMIGTSANDAGYGIAVDSSGDVWITGSTEGNIGGGTVGGTDGFLAKLYATTGAVAFQKNFGTVGNDIGYSIITDSSDNAIVVGSTSGNFGNGNAGGATDAFIAKFDSLGAILFDRNVGGTGAEVAYGVTIGASDRIFITGTSGMLGRYSSGGTLEAAGIIASSTTGYAITTDGSSNIWISGISDDEDLDNGDFGGIDGFVAKYDSSLNPFFRLNIGTASDDEAHGIGVNAAGDAFIFGFTVGDFGNGNVGYYDTFMTKVKSDGTILYSKNTGSTSDDYGYGGILDLNEAPWTVGQSDGDLGDGNSGQWNAFIIKVREQLPPLQVLSLTLDTSVPGTISLSWNPSLTATTYTIQRSDDGGATWIDLVTGFGGTTYNDTTVVLGTTYNYTVTPYNGNHPGAVSPSTQAVANFPAPVVTALDVTMGPTSGSTLINITGQYFESDAIVRVGGRTCTGVTVNSGTSITCTTPIGISGLRDVAVTNVARAQTGTGVGLFSYDATPGFSNLSITSQNLGTSGDDLGYGVAIDSSGNVWIVGYTEGNLGGGSQGDRDAFIAKYDNSGALLFSKNLGTTGDDRARSIALDGNGNAWVAGQTTGNFGGGNQGGYDAFIGKYNTSGALLFVKNVGTTGDDGVSSFALDGSGNAWITGTTDGNLGGGYQGGGADAFIAKYDTSGTLLFSKNLGTSSADYGQSIALDISGNAWVVGYTGGNLGGGYQGGGADAFIAKYDTSGTLLFSKNLGTSSGDYGNGIALDASGNAWITGSTLGNLGGGYQGNGDAFIAKYNSAGALSFSKNLGTSVSDGAFSIALDSYGNAWVGGITFGNLGGGNQGSQDAFIAKYDTLGVPLFTKNLGTVGDDYAQGIALDASGNTWVMGYQTDNFGGGLFDAFLSKIDPVFDIANVSAVPPSIAEYRAVARDTSGNLYTVGSTTGNLGDGNVGSFDIVVAKYSATTGTPGTLIWSETIGTAASDNGYGIAVDSSDAVWVTGSTEGNVGGGFVGGTTDAFLAKLNATTGAVTFQKNFGTTGDDIGYSIATDSSDNAVVVGSTTGNFGNGFAGGATDAFIAKFDSSGTLIFDNNLGSTGSDVAYGVVIDVGADRIFVAGTSGTGTISGYGGTGAFLGSYDSSGAFEVGETIASSTAYAITLHGASDVWITGVTSVDLGNGLVGGNDAFVAKYNSSLTQLFQKNIGTVPNDAGRGIGVNGAGDAFLFGFSDGDFGNGSTGGADAFLTRVKSDGTILYSKNTGSNDDDFALTGILDLNDVPWVAGSNMGDLGDGNSGQPNAFIIKLREQLPPPQVLSLTLDASVGGTVTLTWNSSLTATTYTIARSQNGGATWTTIATGLGGTSYNDTTAVGGTTYSYTVTPLNGNFPGVVSPATQVVATFPNPVVTSLDVTTGPTAGGTLINITGQYFAADATVRIGGRTCTGVTVNSATSITCTTPNGTSGFRDVVVTNVARAQTGTGVGLFSYDTTAGFSTLSSLSITSQNLGTSSGDVAYGIATDSSGNAWISGSTTGNLGGGNQGSLDAFIAKYNSAGTLLFSKNLGTTDGDTARGIALDSSGNAWITGSTFGNLGGGSQGDYDVFIAKYDSTGNLLFSKNLGTSGLEFSYRIAIDSSGNAWVTGFTTGDFGGGNQGGNDAFIAKYDTSGTLLFSKNLGTSGDDRAYGIALDSSGNAWITGGTSGNLGGGNQGSTDAFIAKYDPSGTLLFSKNLGTNSTDDARGIALDSSGNAWITGFTSGNFGGGNQGSGDAFIAKYNSAGTLLVSKNLGTNVDDSANDISLDASGSVWIAGQTGGDFEGGFLGVVDGFIAKFDNIGTLMFARNLGTSVDDRAYGVDLDGSGNAWVAGSTRGNLGGGNQGNDDAFISKIDPVFDTANVSAIPPSTAEYRAVAKDASGNLYTVGQTTGNLGDGNVGSSDVVVAKYFATTGTPGALIWSEIIGTAATDMGYGIAVDSAGAVWVTGSTAGNIGGGIIGGTDAFLAKLNATTGAVTFQKNFGTVGDDIGYSISTDSSNNAIVVGSTTGNFGNGNVGGATDAFIAKFNSSGTLIFDDNVGSTGADVAYGVVVGASDKIFITGTSGSGTISGYGGSGAILGRYSSAGSLEAGLSIASSIGYALTLDGSSNIWIVGQTSINLGNGLVGGNDAFVAKYNSSFTQTFQRNIGSAANDYASGIGVNATGNAFVFGSTLGNVGNGSAGGTDTFVSKVLSNGTIDSSRNTGSTGADICNGGVLDLNGAPWLTGSSDGNLGDGNSGQQNAIIIKARPY